MRRRRSRHPRHRPLFGRALAGAQARDHCP
jgi:hypothetical protein